MVEKGNTLSRNPNVCASCSSMADGMEEPVLQEQSPGPGHGSEVRPAPLPRMPRAATPR